MSSFNCGLETRRLQSSWPGHKNDNLGTVDCTLMKKNVHLHQKDVVIKSQHRGLYSLQEKNPKALHSVTQNCICYFSSSVTNDGQYLQHLSYRHHIAPKHAENSRMVIYDVSSVLIYLNLLFGRGKLGVLVPWNGVKPEMKINPFFGVRGLAYFNWPIHFSGSPPTNKS